MLPLFGSLVGGCTLKHHGRQQHLFTTAGSVVVMAVTASLCITTTTIRNYHYSCYPSSVDAFLIHSSSSSSHRHRHRELSQFGGFRSRLSTSVRRYISASSSDKIAEQIRDTYNDKETDGILDLAISSSWMIDHDLDIEGKLIPAILDAVGGDKKRNGAVASVMNALIGACCYHATNISRSDTEDGYNDDEYTSIKSLLSDRVNTLLLSYENLEETSGISPDIVSYCLAYTALLTDPKEQVLANTILDVARKKSKKIAGGKRRKTLSSSRRKEVSTFTDAELKLKELLGNEFEILLETDEFAVVNKPAGVPCFHRKATTAGKIRRGRKGTDNGVTKSDISLEDALVACNVPLSTLNPDACGLVHRLDRGSSGCMVVAKSDEMHAQLVSEFFLRRTTKKYKTLVQQKPSSSISDDDVGWIDQPVDNRPALSKYRILERYPSERNVALLEFEIFTGRKHQIRVHAAEALSSPVLNDFLYSHNERHDDNRAASSRKNDGQFFLHAFHLSIPRFGIKVEAPVPLWWDETITELKIHQQ